MPENKKRVSVVIRIECDLDLEDDEPTTELSGCIDEVREMVDYDYGQLDPIPENYHSNIIVDKVNRTPLGTMEIRIL